MPPFNTAILAGFNRVFGETRKLGCWHAYLAMREATIELNEKLGPVLSKDLGALAGLFYEVGMGRLGIDGGESALGLEGRRRREKIMAKRHEEIRQDISEENEHLLMQLLLVEVGHELGYDVFVAANDRTRSVGGKSLEFLTVPTLPDLGIPEETVRTISLIDVIWLSRAHHRVVCAFEIEKSTSIYSGMLQLADLAASLGDDTWNFFLVIPDRREKEMLRQMARPSLQSLANLRLRYLRFYDLEKHRHAITIFGEDFTILLKMAREGGLL